MDWAIEPQIIRDEASGITFRFDMVNGAPRLRFVQHAESVIPKGVVREIGFKDGQEDFAGTFVGTECLFGG